MMLKIDTEGNEKRVLQGAIEYFRKHNIQNAIVEVTPGYNFWNHSNIHVNDVIDTICMIIEEFHYIAITLNDWTIIRNRNTFIHYPMIRDQTGQFDIWFTIDTDIINKVGNRTVVDKNIVA